jgi:hypothetical protein
MTDQIDDYIRKTKPAKRRSALHDHAAHIQRLHLAGYTWQQVADYLEEVIGGKRHRNTVRDWWLRHGAAHAQAQAEQNAGAGAASTSARPNVAGTVPAGSESQEQVAPPVSEPHSALDQLLNRCQSDLPGMPTREHRSL